MLSDLLQAWIVITSVVSITLLTSVNAKIRRAGCLIGLAGSPAWLLATSTSEQPGMFVVSIWFLIQYLRGIFPNQIARIIKVLFP